LQTGPDHLDELFGRPFLGGSKVGTNDPASQGPAQLHGVLQGSQALLGAVLILDGEYGEVGGMDRDPYAAFGRQFTEFSTPGFLPRKRGYKGQLIGGVTFGDQRVEEHRVVLRVSRRQAGDAKPDQSGFHAPEANHVLLD
jgi:hypothetical protein